MRRELSLTIAFCLAAESAFAAIPVTDSQRETQEKKISDCMQKARVYKQDTLKPSQGITKSVKTPGSANWIGSAGWHDERDRAGRQRRARVRVGDRLFGSCACAERDRSGHSDSRVARPEHRCASGSRALECFDRHSRE